MFEILDLTERDKPPESEKEYYESLPKDDEGYPIMFPFEIKIEGHSRNTMLKRGEKYYFLEKIRQLLKDEGVKIMYAELDTGDEQTWIGKKYQEKGDDEEDEYMQQRETILSLFKFAKKGIRSIDDLEKLLSIQRANVFNYDAHDQLEFNDSEKELIYKIKFGELLPTLDIENKDLEIHSLNENGKEELETVKSFHSPNDKKLARFLYTRVSRNSTVIFMIFPTILIQFPFIKGEEKQKKGV